ncbi:MAG: DMT family transporter [Pseudomonadota bacterium]
MFKSLQSPFLLTSICIFIGSIIDLLVKLIALDRPVLMLTSWRFLIGAIITLMMFYLSGRATPSFRAIRFHFFRGGAQAICAALFFWSLTQLALAEATILGFLSALMIGPLAVPILGERLRWVSGLAALLGFAGAVLAISSAAAGAPEDGNRALGAAAAIFAAALYALTLVLLRLRTRQEDTLTLVMFSNVMPFIWLSPIWLFYLPDTRAIDIPIFGGLSVLGILVWWLFTLAYARAPAQKLAPFEFTALVWSAIFGALFFAEVPGWQLYAGATLIIAACTLTSLSKTDPATQA